MTSQIMHKDFITNTVEQLHEYLLSSNVCAARILDVLNEIYPILAELPKLNWNDDIESLVKSVKLCVVYSDPSFGYLFPYTKGDEVTLLSAEQRTISGRQLSKRACDILSVISVKMNSKESYGILHTLVEDVGSSPAYKLSDLFQFCPKTSNLLVGDYIVYSDVLNLLKSIIFRAKHLLACAESRKTSAQLFESSHVSFKSISVEMAHVLKDLLGIGIRILREHDFQTTTTQLGLDTVGDFTCEIANSCPFERLDPVVFENLSRYVVKFHSSRPKLYSRRVFTSLCNVLMKYDPEITEEMFSLTEEKLLYRNGNDVRYMNSVVLDCYRSITLWLSAVHLRSPYILDRSLTTVCELKLLSTLCRSKSFSDSLFRDCTLLLGLIVNILRASEVLENNNSKGGYGNLKSNFSAVMNVVIEATNLLCLIVKLCSQQTADDSCPWNTVDDSDQCDYNLNEFVNLWTEIIDLMPKLIASQLSSIPIGILNSIAEFGETLFSLLRETPLQRMIITTVLVHCSSTLKSDIRAKAGRALARLIEFNCMSEDLNFSMDAFDAIKLNMKAHELSVQIAFSWAFGNWSDMYLQECLVSDGQENIMEHNHMISDFHTIIRNSNEAKAKVKYNIFRGAGNLLKFVQYLSTENIGKIKDIVFILIDHVGKGFDFKARWNACCALRNVFTNHCLLHSVEQDVKNRTMQCFIKYMCQSENFKERIQCVVGSSSLDSRQNYGDYYIILWDKLVNAAAVEPPEFFSGVGQAEKLRTEVGRAYLHLISLLEANDLSRLEEIITVKWEGIESAIKTAVASTPLDDYKTFEKATTNLKNLAKQELRPYEYELCLTLYHSLHNHTIL